MKNYVYIIFCVFCLYGCSQVQKATDFITKPSAREIYARTFENKDSLAGVWNTAFDRAKSNMLVVDLPFTIQAQALLGKASALGYKIELKRGDILKILVLKNRDSSLFFIDLFKFETDSTLSKESLVSNEWKADSLSFKTEQSGFYKIVVQPEITDSLVYSTKIYTLPSFEFPVSGLGNNAIGSFWGVARDGGKRSHEGIDIFAKRGTPVTAATHGFISFTGNKGLGGKQVWLRDGLFGQSLYYAHLDSVIISSGTRVKRGDTLGLVGNTGNARTTSPHLHFGIYTRSGAIDPLPFVKKRSKPTLENELSLTKATTKLKNNQLRNGASTTYMKLATLPKNQDLDILGKTQQWYHVQVADSLEGFMHQSLLQK